MDEEAKIFDSHLIHNINLSKNALNIREHSIHLGVTQCRNLQTDLGVVAFLMHSDEIIYLGILKLPHATNSIKSMGKLLILIYNLFFEEKVQELSFLHVCEDIFMKHVYIAG